MPKVRRPYSRVYWEVIDDPKFAEVWDDNHALSTWLRLLLAADMAWPASASIYHGVNRQALDKLVRVGLVDLQPGSRFRIHGLDKEREQRSDAARDAVSSRYARSTPVVRPYTETTYAGTTEGLPSKDEQSKDETSRTRATDQRYGLPHITEVSQSVAESITGMGILTAGEKQLTEWDRLVEFHGEAKVAEAFRRVAKGKRVTYRQLVWDTVKDLEPFAKPTVIEGAKKDEASEADWEARVAATRRETDWIRRHMYPEETDDAA